MFSRMSKKRNTHMQLVGIEISTTITKKSMEGLQN
jgi:hypothetical protein